ncbi:hypothetical protein CCR75_007986 [Bremia lactucae]|uniref:Uncharacterized protein n=1 Tax=Bremia lactucae TaxID=4779 RepID=A0A976IDL4_BRELC|nr:hypothetical protein CCR75_007986 [Bremia lactucae]
MHLAFRKSIKLSSQGRPVSKSCESTPRTFVINILRNDVAIIMLLSQAYENAFDRAPALESVITCLHSDSLRTRSLL